MSERQPVPGWVRPLASAGAIGVSAYVLSWLVAGFWRDGYDPLRQAISETFEIGAPAGPRALVVAGLLLSGAALVGFGPALHRGLPGRGLLGPVLASASGALTIGVVAFPCTQGCPGFGTTTTDTWHVVFAATAYLSLMLAPVAMGVRLRPHLPGLARWSLLLGGAALVGFAVRNAGLDAYGGLQQRVFNTIADVWYLVAATAILRRTRTEPTPDPVRTDGSSGHAGR